LVELNGLGAILFAFLLFSPSRSFFLMKRQLVISFALLGFSVASSVAVAPAMAQPFPESAAKTTIPNGEVWVWQEGALLYSKSAVVACLHIADATAAAGTLVPAKNLGCVNTESGLIQFEGALSQLAKLLRAAWETPPQTPQVVKTGVFNKMMEAAE
jgi:hypothetical protein